MDRFRFGPCVVTKSLIVSSVNELAAEAAVAEFGMVAANISWMAGVMRPEADWRRRLSVRVVMRARFQMLRQ